MLDAAIIWIEANADLLGGIGTLCAATMFLVTNGRTLMQRVGPGSKAITMATPDDAGFIDAAPPAPEYGGRTAIAALPLKEMGTLPDHFVEGLHEDLVADLQKAGFATPTKSAMTRAIPTDGDSHVLARNLCVSYVLEGSIRCQDNSFRVAVQLTDKSGAVAWSDRFNMKGDDMMAMQDAIARRIADSIQGLLTTAGVAIAAPSGAAQKQYRTQSEARDAQAKGASSKSRLITLLLCLFVGIFGAHRFYIGRWFTAILYIPTAGLFTIGWLIDMILILFGALTDRHGRRIRIWLPDERLDV